MIKIFIKSIVWISLHIFYLLPINKKSIYFSSFLGHQYSCNPKYLYEYLLQCKNLNYTYIWEFTDVSKASYVPEAIVVRAKSLKAIITCMTSKYIVYNTEFPWYIPLRKKQILLQTWHGGGAYKKVGIAAGWNKINNLEQKLNSKQISFYVSSSKKFTEVQSISKCVPVQKFINSGMPRNSFLLQNNSEKKVEIIKKLGLPISSRIVLYAPTYRGNPSFNKGDVIEIEQLNNTHLKEVLSEKFGGEWIILYRGHYYLSGTESKSCNDVIDVSDYDDMQELLLISDILITDYSSSMWDFSLMEKPVFLYANDLDSYDVERGFYTSPYTWPFPLAKKNNILEENIKSFTMEKYIKSVREHHMEFGSFECEQSSKKIFDAIGIKTE